MVKEGEEVSSSEETSVSSKRDVFWHETVWRKTRRKAGKGGVQAASVVSFLVSQRVPLYHSPMETALILPLT